MYVMEQRQRVFAVLGAVAFIIAALLVFRPGDRASAGVELADPSAWIEHGLDGELLQINGVTGEVTARVAVAEPGQQIRAVPHGAGAAVLNQTLNTLSLVDASKLAVTGTIGLDLSDGASERTLRVFGGREHPDNVVVVDDDQLLSIDPQTEVVTPIALASPAGSVIEHPGAGVVVLRDDVRAIQTLGRNGLENFSPLAEAVAGDDGERVLVRAGGATWLVDPARLSVVEIGPDGKLGRPLCIMSSAIGSLVGGSPDGEQALLVGYNPSRRLLNMVEPATSTCWEFDLDLGGLDFGPPIIQEGFAYIPNWSDGRIEVVDLQAQQRVQSLPFGTRGVAFDLAVRGSIVWANEPLGPFAAIVDENGLTPVSKLAAIVAGAVEVRGTGEDDTLVGSDIDGPGLRILGDSGDQVVAAATETTSIDGEGQPTGLASGEPSLDTFSDAPTPVPDAIGIALDDSRKTATDPSTALIANFGVSTATAKVDEIVRFTDFSSGSPTSWTWDFGDGTGSQVPDTEKSWSAEGVYLVELRVRNERGDESFLTTEVTVVPRTVLVAPTADFVFDQNVVEVGETLTLESRTVGEVDILEWDLGDGTTTREPIVEHRYADVGVYTVTLIASNPAGSSATATEIIVVSGVEPPRAAIGPLPSRVVEGQFVTLRSASLNDPTTLRWDLGDGTRASGESIRHAWATPGTYRIRLTVENSAGTASTFADVAVTKRVEPPVSQFTQSATEVLVGEPITFSDLSLNQPTRLVWNFGDDTTANGPTQTKRWTQPGRYRVTLRATNEAGTNRSGVTITVIEPVEPPSASFDASTLVAAPGEAVSFQDTSANSPTSWNWDFGDGRSSTDQSTRHSYTSEGSYVVRLTVSNDGGTSSAERIIEVKPPPSANFRWEADGLSVKFTDTSWDDPETYSWSFGDGSTSTERSPRHRFDSAGSYEVTLRVTNGAGMSAPRTRTIRVGSPPVADFDCSADGAVLTCDARASVNAESFRWRTGDAVVNTTPNQRTTTFLFDDRGRYRITLDVMSASGETDSRTKRSPRVEAARAPRVDSVQVVSQDQGVVGLRAVFDRDPTSWEWSVDGGELIEGGATRSPVFRFGTNGRYQGQVRASNAIGSDTYMFSITVDSLVTEASFDWSVVRPGVVAFTNTSTARGDAGFSWRFPGADAVIDENLLAPRVRYPADGGSFDVVLIVTDANGSDRITRRVTVDPA